ncbi:DegT/DnrJ/EryC1/StrS family aminotransferase [Pseudaestuariivita atlantica]|nr:DegT/DnrJ/EryC1/StrS aminotransferase family protein [Pseudaestuariivita atlantica]
MSTVPFHLPHFTDADRDAAVAVMDTRFTTMGTHVAAFEEAFAARHGRAHAVMVNSCTNGHMLVLRYLRGPGGWDEGARAVFPAMTFAGPSFQAAHAGFDVTFADTDPATGSTPVDALIEAAGTAPTILAPLGYGGIPLDGMDRLIRFAEEHGHVVIEDCAHATGASYADGRAVGSLSTLASIWSFYPTKVVNATEGGMILTDDADLAAWCRSARLHGVNKPVGDRYRSLKTDWAYALPIMGHKCNPTNIQGAVGLSQLGRLDTTLARLAGIAGRYREVLAQAGMHTLDGSERGNQHLFVLRDTPRAALMEHLKNHGVQCSVHYPPLWQMEAWGDRRWDLPGAERFAEGCLSLPIYADLTEAQIAQVCDGLLSFDG